MLKFREREKIKARKRRGKGLLTALLVLMTLALLTVGVISPVQNPYRENHRQQLLQRAGNSGSNHYGSIYREFPLSLSEI